MAVTVSPGAFKYVSYDAAEITSVVEEVVAALDLPEATSVRVSVDEAVPMGRAKISELDPVTAEVRLELESGALEDPQRLRQFSRAGAADVIGRLLLQVRDRLDPEFGAPPIEADLSLAQRTAWAVYCAGRQSRLGYPIQRQRRRYAFRTRHGFTDTTDAVFDALWSGTNLTWADVARLSDQALAANPSAGEDTTS